MAKFEAGPGTGGTAAPAEAGKVETIKRKTIALGGENQPPVSVAEEVNKKAASASEAAAPVVEVSEASPADAESIKGVEDAEKRARQAERGGEALKKMGEAISKPWNAARTWLGNAASSLWKRMSGGVSRAVETVAVGAGAALESKDAAVAKATQVREDVVGTKNFLELVGTMALDATGEKLREWKEDAANAPRNLGTIAWAGKMLLQQEAAAAGKAFMEHRYTKNVGKAAKYTGIAVGGAAAAPFALAAAPFAVMFAGPVLQKTQPALYEGMRSDLREKGVIGRYAAADVFKGADGKREISEMFKTDVAETYKTVSESVGGWFRSKWEAAGKAKDKFCGWANEKRLSMMESAGMASSRQVATLMEQNAALAAKLEELMKKGGTDFSREDD
ncbi:hypothetical protein KBD34_00635 [Patescibacteria group bacterium]|nr:hypothetical protein [Patescibacteria group bacterium]